MFDVLVLGSVVPPAPSEVDDGELVEVVRARERLVSWAAAGQLSAIAELARRRPRDLLERPTGPGGHDAGHPGLPEISEFAVDEVAAALRLSRPAAGIRLQAAVELTRLPGTAVALRDGVLDMPKVRAVVDAVGPLDQATALAVEQRVLPRAGRQTVGQPRASLARAVLSVDPAAAEERHARAVDGREVTVRPLPDGMAELWALLPADAATAVYARIDRLARRAPAGDPRGMDARRADALVTAVLTGRPAAGVMPAPGGASALGGQGHDKQTVPADGAAGVRSVPAGGTGGGVRVVPAGGGVESVPADCGGGGPALPAGTAGGAGWATGVRATVHVTVPAATALGLGDQPGDLTGHGPVPASMARRLAAGGSWRKVSTDPASGVVVDVGRPGYTPSAALADLVRARDRTCRFPGCRQPAGRCDLDHVVAWPAGPTTVDNLAALCRHHHRLKHQTQWTVRAGSDGALDWTSPTGHHYPTDPLGP